ncbi:hypothetical protein BD769DRAFT_1385570 [Suillus cothurnatus]|nr:hypothetical protein BD769DRAFT_1385570 [Suillus cothurnatus]
MIKKVRKAIVAAHKEQGKGDQCPSKGEKKLTDWDVTQKLFKHEIDEFDKAEQARKGVKDPIKFHTGHAKEQFNKMSPTQKKEVNYHKNNLKKSQKMSRPDIKHHLNAKKSFSVSSDSIKEWAKTEYSNLDYKEVDEYELPKVVLDDEGYALLPSHQEVTLKNQQELLTWSSVTSHMRAKDIDILWSYWERQSTAQKRLVTFIKASPRDEASSKKDKPYAEVISEDDKQLSSTNLDTTLAAASPVEVQSSDRFAFLDTLSTNKSYLELVDAVKDLATMTENLQSPQEELELPNWVNWSWKDSYLPESVHKSQEMVVGLIEVAMKAASGHSDDGDQKEEMEGADGEEDKMNEREKSVEQDQEARKSKKARSEDEPIQ